MTVFFASASSPQERCLRFGEAAEPKNNALASFVSLHGSISISLSFTPRPLLRIKVTRSDIQSFVPSALDFFHDPVLQDVNNQIRLLDAPCNDRQLPTPKARDAPTHLTSRCSQPLAAAEA